MSNKQVIDKVTVNRLNPESKMLVFSTYHMMINQTLAKPLYENVHNRASFHEIKLPNEVNSKFNFDIS